MKPWITGIGAAGLILFFFPTTEPLSSQWSKVLDIHLITKPRTDSTAPVEWALLHDSLVIASDSLAKPADPFGLPPEPIHASNAFTSIGPIAPPPARVWHATGRVGKRAAVLTSNDGRILVVSDGSPVDSARVISIGNEGVTLEDRAGSFVLRIP